ncbi:MAG: class II fructose-bisphosphate aldolase [Ignavibacteriae bacterium]|nr:class II fructose-bisphosphate aldolase [Ignavibacteriota bacterium]
MSVVDYKKYCEMIDNAKKNKFAYAAINVVSESSANAVLSAFAETKSDGIIQLSTGGGEFASGQAVKDAALGSISVARHVHFIADKYDVNVALHTDHCQANKVESFLKPLLAESRKRVANGEKPLFSSHMFDGSALPLKENMDIAVELLKECAELGIILEVEAGVVGGEEDGINNEDAPAEKLYTTPEDMIYVHERLSAVEGGRYMFAATFGNVHGVYKPGNVKLTPKILKDGQAAVVAKHGEAAHFDLVFHGGSGSTLDEIRETLDYGVIKMNVDTDTQYAFTRPIVDHMLKNYDAVLKVEQEVGVKKFYDPRGYLKKAENAMKDRVIEAIRDLRGEGTTLGK